ncbi:cupin domain-containing protein [Reinekea marinisedimentorum]|uniref:50S ribosomal protein L16 3-hydroxylase n=1 Tax=Reinekea marinisedimentorum TaxID=230495 RepID=A0A4R3I894_9GAMM|nr:cupin domain-containing protein [Reinekea marinisedimentorum]TCS42472.1 50S ribosomal protein L16 3-hydroxylase [Reinekea marinisedimentorum]
MSSPLKHFDTKSFLNNHWQQSPLLVRQALTVDNLISKEDLFSLAQEAEVESRIIIGDPKADNWDLQHGPFDQDTYDDLPETHWTLLVQAVDHWLENIREVLQSFSFLPRWRVDDIMISYSPQHGGVGPHYDLYDVFLIQLQGNRIWRAGQLCDDETDVIDGLPVKVISDFQEQDSWEMSPGDMLYLPPGIAHWGESLTESITLSVGFRAPSDSEFITDFGYFLSEKVSEFSRYSDQKIKDRSASPYQIRQEDVDRLKQIMLRYQDSDELLASWLGQYMTEPKYDDTATENENMEMAQFVRQWQANTLYKNPSSRMAYCEGMLFADGQDFETTLSFETLNLICQLDTLHYSAAKDFSDVRAHNLMWQLLTAGVVFFDV